MLAEKFILYLEALFKERTYGEANLFRRCTTGNKLVAALPIVLPVHGPKFGESAVGWGVR